MLFDVGGVLARTDDSRKHRAWEARLRLGDGELTHAIWRSQVGDRAVVGGGTEPEVWRNVAREFGLSDEELAQLHADFYAGEQVDRELVRFVRHLRPRFKTALLSNAYTNARELFATKFGIHNVTDEIIISAEVGLSKPDVRIFQLAADRLGVQPREAVFVDDVAENVAGAQAAGMIGIQFRNRDQTIAEVLAALAES